jgi:hypothetical protein|tara:strand:- start:437 stop:1111 length:675 start_codon:yes stop_codon:yes gene_type:complete
MGLQQIKYGSELISPLGLNKDYWFWKSELIFDHKKAVKFFLKIEKELIKKYPATYDGDTQLPESVTARYMFYNLFSLKKPSKELTLIKNFIKSNVKDFLSRLKVSDLNGLWIMCWFNALRKGECISEHSHYNLGNSHESFVSGHFCVNASNTTTFYRDIGGTHILPVKNEIGQLSFFPSYLKHWSDKHEGDDARITMAFDIYFKREFVKNKQFLKNKTIIPLEI